ncbi:hypothetical protein [Roseibium sp.]|uniref:hypothetical protein n=1 Tax=Roseibium sp. TaxID=1936156 RepID=UPI003BAA80A5
MTETVVEDVEEQGPRRKTPNAGPISNLIIGLWLVLLYVVTIAVSILMLSSYQIQSRMQYVNISDTRLSIWRLIELSNVYSVDKSILESRLFELDQMQSKLDGIVARRKQFDQEYTEIFDPFYVDVRDFKTDIETSYQGFVFRDLEKHKNSVKVIYTDLSNQLRDLELSEVHKSELQELEKRQKRGDDVFRNLVSAKKNEFKTEAGVKKFREKNKEYANKIRDGVFTTISLIHPYNKLDENEKVLLQDAVSEFSSLKDILWRLPYRLSIMPSEILVLFLVLAMGVLGSTIFITQLYFQKEKYEVRYHENLNVAFFFSRPWFGAITALSIYVLANAGVLFLTDPSAQSGRATLSPFFISFIAIISGLFSEQAIQAIKSAANNWFKQQELADDRWGVGLSSILKEKGKEASQLAELTGVPLASVQSWIAEKKPVPPHMQETLSIWLEVPVRQLFTDIPPNETVSNHKSTDEKIDEPQ